jgi:hypothetical protein
MSLAVRKFVFPDAGTPVVVRDRGLGRVWLYDEGAAGGCCCKSGVVGEELVGEGTLGEWLGDKVTVW